MAKADSNVVLSAFTEQQVERLTGVSLRQLRYWDRTKFFIPHFAYEDRKQAYSRIYSFRDMAALKVLNSLRNDAKVSLPHLREVKDRLIHLGDDLWSKTVLYVLNRKVVFKNPKTLESEEVVSGQGVLQIPLQVISGDIEKAVIAMRTRESKTVGQIERRRGFAHHQWVVAGTRIPIRAIKEFFESGLTYEQIRQQYPSLTIQDIEAALTHEKAA